MNILYIDHYAGSISMGMEFRPYYMAREWQKIGHAVRIIAADYSHLRVRQPEASENFAVRDIDGVAFQLIQAGTYDGNGAKRAISMFRFAGGLWLHAGRLAKAFQPDIVISSSTYPLDSYACRRIAKKSRARYIHEAHDVWPLTLIELGGMSKRHPFVVLLNAAEKYAYRKCDKVISILPGVLPHMLEQGLQSDRKFAYIPNGIVLDDWNKAEPLGREHQAFFRQMREEGKFVIEYLGGHALSNALDQVLDAAKIMQDENAAFVLIGKGVEKERLKKRVKDESIANVFFLPPIPKTQVPNALKEADALYIGAAPCSLYRFGISMNKLYDYMMSGRPVLYGVVASNNEVEEAGCGISFDSSKPEEIVNAIKEMMGIPEGDRNRMGANGKNWVIQNCDYKKLAGRFLDFVKQD